MFEFLIARVKQKPRQDYGHWGCHGALETCAICQNKDFAIKLLEKGVQVPTDAVIHTLGEELK
jgi:hypothetical protein